MRYYHFSLIILAKRRNWSPHWVSRCERVWNRHSHARLVKGWIRASFLEDSLNALTLDLTIHHPNRGWWSKEEHSREKMLQSYRSEEGQAQRELCFSKGVTHMCACRKMDVQGCSFQIIYIRKPEIRQKPSVEGWLYKSWSFLQKVPVNHTHIEQISEEVWREP